jgi:hypothetical protein
VNKNLREASHKIEDLQINEKNASTHLNYDKRDLAPNNAQEQSKPLQIDSEKPNINSDIDLQSGFSKSIDYTSPRNIIQMELADKQDELRSQEEFRREYIRQFIVNAKKGGWKVDIDSNGNIKSAQPIKTQPKVNVFSPTADSDQ